LGVAPTASAGATDNKLTYTIAPSPIEADVQLQKQDGLNWVDQGTPQLDKASGSFDNLPDGVYRIVAVAPSCNGYVSPAQDMSDAAGETKNVNADMVCDFVPLEPHRLLETRSTGRIEPFGTIPVENAGKRAANQITKVRVRGGSSTVPADAAAVVLNITAVNSDADNYLTVWDCTDGPENTTTLEPDPPTVSNVNPTTNVNANDARAGAAISKIGGTGDFNNLVCIYNYKATDLVLDVTGYFSTYSIPTHLNLVTPVRKLDTRPEFATPNWAGGKPEKNQVITLALGVPNNSDAIVNITGVQGAGGWITAWDCADNPDSAADIAGVEPDPPTASNVNIEPNITSANHAVVHSTNGSICLYTSALTHIIVDLVGYFPAAANYNAVAPRRVLETRPNTPSAKPPIVNTNPKPNAGGKILLDLDEDPAGDPERPVPVGTKAVVLNVTGTQPNGGYVTVYPCTSTSDNPPANTSSLNLAPNQSRPNLVIIGVNAGKVCLYTQNPTHLIADLVGYFPG
jgi:hypothetical protein